MEIRQYLEELVKNLNTSDHENRQLIDTLNRELAEQSTKLTAISISDEVDKLTERISKQEEELQTLRKLHAYTDDDRSRLFLRQLLNEVPTLIHKHVFAESHKAKITYKLQFHDNHAKTGSSSKKG